MNWTTAIAAYAAGVSTVVGARQVMNERPRVTVSVIPNAAIYGGPARDHKEEAIWLTITNAGRRPVIIKSVAFLPPKRGWFALPSDWIEKREVPFALGDGQFKQLILYKRVFSKERPPPPDDATWMATDSLGRAWPRAARWRYRARRLGNRWRRFVRHEEPWDAADRLARDAEDAQPGDPSGP